MKRILTAAVALIGVVALTACLPNPIIEGSNQGFTQARYTGGTIWVDNRTHMGVDANNIIDDWNRIAGRNLFAAFGRGDPNGVYADVTWEVRSPICPTTNCSDRRSAWVQPTKRADGSYSHCTIWLDPWWEPPASWEKTLEHELGHCLGFIGGPYVDQHNPDYHGVMSYFAFKTQAEWYNAADVEMLQEAGYR